MITRVRLFLRNQVFRSLNAVARLLSAYMEMVYIKDNVKVPKLLAFPMIKPFETSYSQSSARKSLKIKGFKIIQLFKVKNVGQFETTKLKKLAVSASNILGRPFVALRLAGWHFIFFLAVRS